MKGGFKKFMYAIFEGSAVMRTLTALISFVYGRLSNGIYSFVFGSYDDIGDTFSFSAMGSAWSRQRGKACKYIANSIEKSVYVQTVATVMQYLSRLSMRVIGVFLISSGLYTLVAQTVMFFVVGNSSSIPYSIVGAGMVVVGLSLLLSGKALCRVLYESKIFGSPIRKLCGFKERNFALDEAPTGKVNGALLLGLPFGLLSCFVNPLFILAGILGLIFAYVVLIRPECGYIAAVFALPFFVVLPSPSILLSAFVIYIFICYIIKLVMGKRYFRLDLPDVLVACFMGVLLLGGVVSYGGTQSLKVVAIFVSLMLGYFLTVGLVNDKEMLKRTAFVLGGSLLAVAAVGLYQNFTGNISEEWIDTEMFEEISGRVVSTFENPNMLGEYLILLLPMIFAMVIGEEGWYKRVGYLLVFAAGAGCLIFTWARGAWLGFILSGVVFLLMWNRKSLALIAMGIAALPFAVPYLPSSIVSRFTSIGNLSDTSTNYRVFIWRGSANLAADYALTGIGVGEQAFDRVYPYYAFAGIEKAPHAHNLFLQLFIEVGIFGFIVFLAVMFCLLQNGFSLAKNGEDNTVRLIGCGAMCGVLAALVQGMTDYIWYNYRVFFIFWIMIGLVCAARRIDYVIRKKHEKEHSEYSLDITL